MPSAITGFDFQPRTRIVFGNGQVDRLGELASEIGGTRVLVVTDPGIVAAGHVDHAARALEGAGLAVTVFDGVRENPTTLDVDACLETARAGAIDCIVGLGGGSSIDTAKGCNFVLTNGGRMQDYWGTGKASRPMLPLIAVPTTAGTGSECQSYALIADEATHQKMACGDPKAAAAIALLDPTLTVSQPRAVTACTGIDALAHAVETAVTRKRNEISTLFSREAFRLIVHSLTRVLADADDLEARGCMLLGAAYAGIAIENSMLGAAHSTANPLTARYGTVHGQAVGTMLPHVVRYNAADPEARELYELLARYGGVSGGVQGLVGAIEALLGAAELPRSVAEAGVDEAAIPELARQAAEQWTARFNPRAIGATEFQELYRSAM